MRASRERPFFKAGAKRRSIVRWSTGRFEPGGVSRDAISSAEQPTDASSSTFPSSIGIFGLAIQATVSAFRRRFAPTLKKGRYQLAHMLRSQLVRRAMGGDTAALIFACKTILGLREPRGDEFNVHVSATATANAKPASF